MKFYLFGDKLRVRVASHSLLHAMETDIKSIRKEGHAHFLSVLKVHEITPNVHWYLKGFWLKEFPQQTVIAINIS